MSITREKTLTADQQRRYDVLYKEWMAEVANIPDRPPDRQGIAIILNEFKNDSPYRILERKYIPLINAILDESECEVGGGNG